MRRLPALLTFLAFAACSAKAPAPAESRSTAPGIAAAAPAPAAPAAPAVSIAVLPPPDPREAALAGAVLQLLEQEHLLRKHIDDTISREAFATYMDRIDGSKMFLLKADRDSLGKYTDKIDDELRSGSLDLAHDGAKIFAARVGVVDKVVATLLAASFDHTNDEWIELDPKKLAPAVTEDELVDRWRQRLELEVLERVTQMEERLLPPKKDPKAAKKPSKPNKDDKANQDAETEAEDRATGPLAQIPTTPEGRDTKARADLARSYAARFARLRTPEPLDAAADLVNAVTSTLDPHTDYLPPADKANFDLHMSGTLEGIGAVLREHDHYIEIVEIVPGGASSREGTLKTGDLILSVAAEGAEPVDVVDMRIDEVVKMIRGPKGTVVHLRIQKPSGTQQSVAITRDVVIVDETYARGAVISRKGQPSLGYIHLPSFYGGKGAPRTAAKDVGRLLAEMKTRKVAGVVIDIRSNGGGLLGDAVTMTGELIDQGPVVQVQDSRGRRETLSDDKKGTEYDGPVIVMVDRFSASASEILAGALQDYHRALIVGTGPTHGKGTVQTLADLDQMTNGKIELGVLKLTIQQFFRPSGSSTQREGVTPDVLLPDPAGHIETGERTLDHAIAWSKVPPANHDTWPTTWKPETLAANSAARVAKQPVFTKIAALTKLLKARSADTRVPLAKPAWLARRKEQRAALDAASPDLAKNPPSVTVTQIDDPNAVPPAKGAPPDDRLAKWRENIARDPWIDESLRILGEMAK